MKFSFLILTMLICRIGYAQDSKIEGQKKDRITSLISLFKQQNIHAIAARIHYPLKRENPIPDIKNANDFVHRFNEIFDQTLVDKIANAKSDQWKEVGWRGIMLDNGTVWMDGDEGKITAINYQTTAEKNLLEKLIRKQKKYVHPSLEHFKRPVYTIKTAKYLIRIDELSNGMYRYACWKIGNKENTQPDMILNNGKLEFEGSGGNHVITFINKNYSYSIHRNFIGEDETPDITLQVQKDNKNILSQGGVVLAE